MAKKISIKEKEKINKKRKRNFSNNVLENVKYYFNFF